MEVSVSFTDGSKDLNADGCRYDVDESQLGRVWIPKDGLLVTPPVRIRYEKHPWIEKFEFDGLRAAPAKRKGIGTKGAKGFVRSLSTIYSPAYEEYREYGGDEAFDAAGYFARAADSFITRAGDKGSAKMVRKFCGFTENMWREGDEEMLDICIGTIVPRMLADNASRTVFEDSITQEFRDYLKGETDNGC